jgi:rusticyanin
MTRKRIGVLAGLAVIAAAGIGVGVAVATGGPGSRPAAAGTPAGAGYSWYQSMMSRYYGGSMMGGSPGGWMMGRQGYQWMMGGAGAPGWMRGGRLPGSMMMSGTTDPGQVMGKLWADAPGPRVGAAQAIRLGGQIPAGASINRAANTVTFATASVHLVAVASPAGGPDETFRIAGLVNPAITVPAGAKVSIEVINADPDTAHGLVITASADTSSPMPMMTSRPAFADAAVWFLGNPTTAGMHAGTLTFTAATPGTYQYLCPVPGHAQKGMAGTFTVSNAS